MAVTVQIRMYKGCYRDNCGSRSCLLTLCQGAAIYLKAAPDMRRPCR